MLDFPNSPTVGQVFGNWKWDGTRWVATAPAPGPSIRVQTVVQVGATLMIDRNLGENCFLNLTETISSVEFMGWPASGSTGKIRLIIYNTGAFGITGYHIPTYWPGGVVPVITPGPNKRDILLFMSDDGGSTIYGSVVGLDYF